MTVVAIGVGVAATMPAHKVIETARAAERLGYDAFWLTDSHLATREAMTLLGALAVSTRQIKLGTGVSHLAGRHPSVLASAMATLDELAPGRIRLGIGVGDSGPLNLGVPRTTLSDLEAGVTAIRSLLQGEETPGASRPLRLSYVARRESPVSIYVAATGQRALRMAGRIADAALVSAMPERLRDAIEMIREGERAAGRPARATRVLFWTTVAADADRELARSAVRGSVARRAMNTYAALQRENRLDLEDAEALARLQAAHNQGHIWDAGYADLVPEAWIDRFAIAGTPEEVRARLERAMADGADEISMILMTPRGERGSTEGLERFAEAVLTPLRLLPA